MNDETTRLLEHLADTFPDQPAPLPRIVAAAHAGRRRRARRNAALAVAALAMVAVAGVAVQQALSDPDRRSDGRVADTVPEPPCDKGNPVPPREPVPQGPDYPTNAAGETYGSALDNSPQPDLLAAIGDCGRTGYIRPAGLDEAAPWVPGAGSGEPQSTPVYESDGVTQIDTFTQGPGTTIEDGVTDPPARTDGPDAADLEGTWTAIIAGVTGERGEDAYDTYRDLDLWVTFHDGRMQVHDGCQTVETAFSLDGGTFALTDPDPFALVLGGADPGCARSAPLAAVVENVRHVTQSGRRTYLHLENFRIAVVLTPAD